MSEQMPKAYIPTLDGWRAIAILAVIASHSQRLVEERGAIPCHAAAMVLGHLRLGVDLFFAISGFLITKLLVQEYERTGAFGLRAFYVRRLFRILPLVVTYLLVLGLATLVMPGLAAPWEFFATLLFARNYLMHWGGVATGQFWSLSVEEHFYLLWPPLLAILGPRRGVWAGLVAAISVGIWRAIDSRYHVFVHAFGQDPGVTFRSDTRFDALLLGAVPALLWKRTETIVSRLGTLPVTGAALLAIVVTVSFHVPLMPTVLAVLFPALVVSTVFRPSSTTSGLLETKPLRWVGGLSYSLYIWQTLFLQVPQVSFSHRASGSAVHVVGAYALDLSLIFGCSLLTSRLIEIPLRHAGRRFASMFAAGR